MKNHVLFLILLSFLTIIGCTPGESKKNKKIASYALGVRTGMTIKNEDIDMADFYEGIDDVMDGKDSSKYAYTEPEMREAIQKNRERRQIELESPEEKKIRAFFVESAKNPAIKVVSSEVHIQVLTEGKPTELKINPDSSVTISYQTANVDGKELDKLSQKSEIPLRDLPSCIRYALMYQKPGDKIKIFCVSHMFGAHAQTWGLKAPEVIVVDLNFIQAQESKDPRMRRR